MLLIDPRAEEEEEQWTGISVSVVHLLLFRSTTEGTPLEDQKKKETEGDLHKKEVKYKGSRKEIGFIIYDDDPI